MAAEMKTSRRRFLGGALAGGVTLVAGSIWPVRTVSPATHRDGPRFRFIHFTDIHVQPELNAARGYAQAIHHMNQHRAEFALSGGDLVFDVLRASRDRCERLWKLYTSLSERLEIPLWNVMGNHDNFGLQNSAISPSEPGYGKQKYLDSLGLERSYYSFDHRGWHFIVLDSILPVKGGWAARLDDEQMAWLKEDLKSKGDRPAVVALHVPVVTFFSQIVDGPEKGNPPGRAMADAKELRELFEAHNVKLVLQGHVHIRERFEYNGVTYITSGAVSGSWWNGPRFGHPEGYAVVEIEGDGFTWTYHTFGWVAKRQAKLNEDDRRVLQQLYSEREVFALV